MSLSCYDVTCTTNFPKFFIAWVTPNTKEFQARIKEAGWKAESGRANKLKPEGQIFKKYVHHKAELEGRIYNLC